MYFNTLNLGTDATIWTYRMEDTPALVSNGFKGFGFAEFF